MELLIHYFAGLKEHFGKEESISLNDGSTVVDLKKLLIEKKPESEDLLLVSRAAYNGAIVEDTFPMTASGEVDFLPPSSGG